MGTWISFLDIIFTYLKIPVQAGLRGLQTFNMICRRPVLLSVFNDLRFRVEIFRVVVENVDSYRRHFRAFFPYCKKYYFVVLIIFFCEI